MTKQTKSENPILYICDLGASVGCERRSEHSTRHNENHKYRGLDSQTFVFWLLEQIRRKIFGRRQVIPSPAKAQLPKRVNTLYLWPWSEE